MKRLLPLQGRNLPMALGIGLPCIPLDRPLQPATIKTPQALVHDELRHQPLLQWLKEAHRVLVTGQVQALRQSLLALLVLALSSHQDAANHPPHNRALHIRQIALLILLADHPTNRMFRFYIVSLAQFPITVKLADGTSPILFTRNASQLFD